LTTVRSVTSARADESVSTSLPSRPRRWVLRVISPLIVVFGLLATSFMFVHLTSRPGVYWSRVQVVLLPPPSSANPNGLTAGSESLIDTAALLAIKVGSSTHTTVVSDAVTVVDQGIRHGYRVRLPNAGGQWSNNFDQPSLDVQAVASTPAELDRTMSTVLASIQTVLATVQHNEVVDATNRISTTQSPAVTPTYYRAGSKARAALAILVVGASLTAAALAVVARTASRVQRRTPRVS
jgi:hypothetical protein